MDGWRWDEQVAREVASRFEAWTSCIPHRIDELAGHLHEGFVYVSVMGRRYDKSSYLDLAAAVEPGARFTIDVVRARVRDDVATVDGAYTVVAMTGAGEDLSAQTLFTGTWVRAPSGWVCLTHHGTHREERHPV